MVKGDSSPIQRTDKGKIYSCISTTDGGPRPKYMANKHPYPEYHAILHLRMAYTVNTLYNTIL